MGGIFAGFNFPWDNKQLGVGLELNDLRRGGMKYFSLSLKRPFVKISQILIRIYTPKTCSCNILLK